VRALILGAALLATGHLSDAQEGADGASAVAEGPELDYREYVRRCIETLMEHGTDRYGETHAPILVSILDVSSRECPRDPAALDEAWRVTRRERRNPAGSNLLTDQPLLRTMFLLSRVTGRQEYATFAREYAGWVMEHLVDEKGLFWWGWHRHYDVFADEMTGHAGNHHEIHAIHSILWGELWEIDAEAVRAEIEAIWNWHVIDRETGEINRHADGQRGCDFSMSAGAFLEAFAFLYERTEEPVWLERAKLLAEYYWERRHQKTNLFPERPNAGADRFDGGSFVTSITGCYVHSLLRAHERTGEPLFLEHAVAILNAYGRLGWDVETQRFWGALRLDGTPIRGPRLTEGYAMYEPRGPLDLWEPYAAGYQYAVYTAQAYAHAYDLTRDAQLLEVALRFADWIEASPPARGCHAESWYAGYALEYAPRGTHAGKYGRAISFLVHLYASTGEERYLGQARELADQAIAKLWHDDLFRGHPAKPYYEAMDGVGYLLYALLTLDVIGSDRDADVALDNW